MNHYKAAATTASCGKDWHSTATPAPRAEPPPVCCSLPVLYWQRQSRGHSTTLCSWRGLCVVFLGCLYIWDTDFWDRGVFLCSYQWSESWKQTGSLQRVSRSAPWITSGWSLHAQEAALGDAQKAVSHSADSFSSPLSMWSAHTGKMQYLQLSEVLLCTEESLFASLQFQNKII